MDYELVDSGGGRKLERFGPYLLDRPAAQAAWMPENSNAWKGADATFDRQRDDKWQLKGDLPESWTAELAGIKFKLSPTDFGHLGIFPEQEPFWRWIQEKIRGNASVLNLFAYSGGSTLAAAKAGAEVCHLDASKGMVAWARENAALNRLEGAPVRWIADDVKKFLAREEKRGRRYDAIILDPPTFGRGTKGELFKIEEDLIPILQSCRRLLSDRPLFVLLSCHTPGYTPTVLGHLLKQMMPEGAIDTGEMFLAGKQALSLPSGSFARWQNG